MSDEMRLLRLIKSGIAKIKEIAMKSTEWCLLCGQQVKPDSWRDHMLTKHKMVLSESPQNEDGSWKEFEALVKDISECCEKGEETG